MLNENAVRKIVITGPESTGKTELARALAQRFGTSWVPEYARDYIEKLDRPYEYSDVLRIAPYQINEEAAFEQQIGRGVLFFDTWLILTKVWLDVVYGECPQWITDHIWRSKIDLFLVCSTDLQWIADPVRENGGERREQLLNIYCNEISSFGFEYEIVNGFGSLRTENALNALSRHGLNLPTP